MTYYDLIKTHSKGKSEAAMWQATKLVSDAIEPMKTSHPDDYLQLMMATYAIMAGPHFNEEFGLFQIAGMFYKDKHGNTHHAPHWTTAQYAAAYDAIRPKLKDDRYTAWDVAVTLEMLHSDYVCTLRDWFPSDTDQDIDNRIVALAIAYLNDPDDPNGGKIWHRFHPLPPPVK